MRCLTPLLLATLANCAAGAVTPRSGWPSLSKRAVERPVVTDASVAAAAVPVARPAGDVPVAAGADVTAAPGSAVRSGAAARLALAARDIDGLEERWRAQQAAAQRAIAAAQARPGGDATATAQLEAGRLDKLSGQLIDERAQLESITGDLARAAAAGTDVDQPLRAAGMLLERIARLTSGGAAAGGAKAR